MDIKRGNKLYIIIPLLLVLGTFAVADISTPSSISLNVLTILYEKFNSDTTDFNSFNESGLRNMSNVILEISQYGQVEFEENLDIVSMAGGDYLVDFDSDVNISDNFIYVDYLDLPGINKQAVLTFRDVVFENPVIYNKGVECSDCELISYSDDVLIFRTPSFEGPYYIREEVIEPYCGDGTCDPGEDYDNCRADCEEPYEPPEEDDDGGDSSAGGGGGGDDDEPEDEVEPPEGMYDFNIYPPLVEMKLRKGAYFQEEIRVENNGTKTLDISVLVEELGDYIFPRTTSFKIEPGEIRDIAFDVYISESVPADVYLGKIRFLSYYVQRESDVVLQVRKKEALFDLRTTVLKKYVNQGGRVKANITVINMGDLRNFDVNLEIKVLDFDKNEYTSKMEQFAINQTHNNIYFMDLPRDITPGDYVFYSTVNYKDINASSYDVFVVEIVSSLVWWIIVILIIILMIIAIIWYRKRKAQVDKKYNEIVDKIFGREPTEDSKKSEPEPEKIDEEDLKLP